MLGNVWEWVEDCYLDSYRETPADGSANTAGPCDNRVLRAGSWFFGPSLVRAALRNHIAPGTGIYTGFGFRVAKSLTP